MRLLITKTKKGLLLSLSVKFFSTSVNIWQSYNQLRGCLVHFLRFLAVWWSGTQSARDNHLIAWNPAKHSPFKKIFTTDSLATLPCNLLLIVHFLAVMFQRAVWRHMQGAVGFLITTLVHIYYWIIQWKNIENQLRFDSIMAMSLWPHFLTHRVHMRKFRSHPFTSKQQIYNF